MPLGRLMDVPDDHQSSTVTSSSSTECRTSRRRSTMQSRCTTSSTNRMAYSHRLALTKITRTKLIARNNARARGAAATRRRFGRCTNKLPSRRTANYHRNQAGQKPRFSASKGRGVRHVRSGYKRRAPPNRLREKRLCSAERIRCHADASHSGVSSHAINAAASVSKSPSVSSQRLSSSRGRNQHVTRRYYRNSRPTSNGRRLSSFGDRRASTRCKLKAIRHSKSTSSVDLASKESREAFIKNFAVPTHLYRYLAERHHHQPLYLDRTLSYLRAPPSSSTCPTPNGTTRRSSRLSADAVADRIWQSKRLSSMQPDCVPCCLAPSNELSLPIASIWPHEVQLIFEGFYDSEKELDWVTVEASIIPCLRFAWTWRHKAASADTLVTPFSDPFPLACHHPATGLDHLPPSASVESCRFQPGEMIRQAKWATSGGRLSGGQLELRIHATERRWLKRPDLNRPNSAISHGLGCHGYNGLQTNNHHHRPIGIPQCNRKGGLGSSAYPVHYTTAPLPLFYSAVPSASNSDRRPFLLTPGVYELRLGVDHVMDNHLPGKTTPTVDPPTTYKQNGMLENGYYHQQHHHHSETGSTADSVTTSTSDCPNGAVSSASEVTSMSEAGSVCGRVEWRRMRLPKDSDASDEYTRWPKLRFRVLWHGKACDSPTSLRETRSIDQMNGVSEHTHSVLRKMLSSVSSPSPRKLCKTTLIRASATPIENGAPLTLTPKSPLKLESSNEPIPDRSVVENLQLKSTARTRKSSARPYILDRAVLPDRPVLYGFVYMGQLQQWSESNDFRCPWCRLDCWRARERAPDALLSHLRTCHPRFRFKACWSPARSQLTLEVSLNEAYDGSNDCGLRRWSYELTSNLHGRWCVPRGQLIGGWTGLGLFGGCEQSSKSLSLSGSSARVPCPVRRLPYTHLIFWRGAERVHDQPFDPTLSVRPIATGHNRVYYHTRTVQPIRACEFDVDSEAEDSPIWLCQHYQRKLEEFTDVNQGEKQIMQLWNSLLLSLGPSELITCDSQLANVASCFVHRFASHIHRRHLRTNMLLHFTNLVDYGLLSTGQLRQLVTIYDNLVSSFQPPGNTT